MSNITTITVPKGIEYISNIPEFNELYNGDFPENTVINKQITGIGGSSLVLTNDVPYVIAVHLIDMIKCKVGQTDLYPNVLGVYGGVTTEDIKKYVANGGKKIMVTYDSLPKVREALGDKAKDFKLLVDEFHKLISYLADFKPTVAVKLLENSNGFKSVSYLTATPTNYKYLPEPMKKLDILEFDWEAKVKPDLKHCYVNQGMVESVLATSLDLLDNTTDELYIFYNSKSGVASFIKKLLKCKKDLSLSDINILFAKSDKNTQYFKKHLGKNFAYGEIPNGENNKRINLISSMGFEGIDFYPNHVTGALPTSIVVSDPNAKSMLYDISIDLVQILGRHRKNKVTGKPVHNKVIYLWNTQNANFTISEEEYLELVTFERNEIIRGIDALKDNSISTDAFIKVPLKKEINGKSLMHNYLLLEDDNVIIHPYSIEAQMSSYNACHSDSFILNNFDENGGLKDDSSIITKLMNLNPALSTYTIPLLSSVYVKALGRTPSVKKLISEYEMLIEEVESTTLDRHLNEECKDDLEKFLLANSMFREWIESGISTATMYTLKQNRELINERMFFLNLIENNKSKIKDMLALEVGKVYYTSDIVERLKNTFSIIGVDMEIIKATIIKEWYEIKLSSKRINGIPLSAYKIVKEL